MLKLLEVFIVLNFFVFLTGCENPLEDRVDELEKELNSQKQTINSLVEQIYLQQSIIDSLNNNNREYSDSLYNELELLVSSQNETIQLLISSLPKTGKDFIRIDSLQICWGSGYGNVNGAKIEFPVAFIEPPKVFITSPVSQDISGITNITTTSAIFYTYSDRNSTISFCAIGKWQ
jgi:uncharacterized coiled-coil protein SlyX